MKYDHNQICTTGKAVEIGKEYDYQEDGKPCRVRIVSEEHKDGWIGFKLAVVADPYKFFQCDEFTCGAATGTYAYGGMWRLYDAGEYIPVGELKGA